MPSVSVPPVGSANWKKLQASRRAFWKKPANNKLSAHFKADEFYCHDGSAPPTKARPAMVRLCTQFLEPMRAKFGECNVLSGYRHSAYNASIGGARNSQHIYDDTYESVAADQRYAKGSPAQWVAYAKTLRTKQKGRGGIGRYDHAGFIHIDNRAYKADWTG